MHFIAIAAILSYKNDANNNNNEMMQVLISRFVQTVILVGFDGWIMV